MLATRIAAIVSAAGMALGGWCSSAHAQLRVAQWNITNWAAASSAARAQAFKTAIYGTVPSGLLLAGKSMSPDILIVQEIVQDDYHPVLPLPLSDSFRATGQANLTGVNVGGVNGANGFLSILNNAPGSPGDWAAAPYVGNQGDTGNAMFYRTSKVSLLTQTQGSQMDVTAITLGTLGVDVCSGSMAECNDSTNQAARDNQRWRVRMAGYTGQGAELYIYSGHFKSGSASADQLRREPEARRIRADANGLPTGIGGFLLAGDFNIQSSSQKAYKYLVEYSATTMAGYDTPTDVRQNLIGQFADPINKPGSWNNNCAFRNIHTQEPTNNTPGADPANGGMDDRHDQILISSSLRDGQGMSYIPEIPGGNILAAFINPPAGCTEPSGTFAAKQTANNPSPTSTAWRDTNHSYRCWGNDGNHYNNGIAESTLVAENTMVGQAIAQALVTTCAGNGHLPVFLDMQVPARLGGPAANSTIDFGTVNQNAAASTTLNITNAANVALFSRNNDGWGVDGLTYTLAATAGFTAPSGTFERPATAAPPQANMHTIIMNTSSLGTKTGTITITSDDPDNPTRVINLTGMVVSPTILCCKGATCTTMASASLCAAADPSGVTGVVIAACNPNHTSNAGCCFADFNHSGVSTIDDLFIYINSWLESSSFAKFNGNGTGTPSIDDLFTFINAWLTGCTNP